MSPDMMADVVAFHGKFGLTMGRSPRRLTRRKAVERINFLAEELAELKTAVFNKDLPGQADALVDIVYVALGTAAMMGLPWGELWDDVQRANMAKVRGVGKRGNLEDVVKPPGWAPPNGSAILRKHGYDKESTGEADDKEHQRWRGAAQG